MIRLKKIICLTVIVFILTGCTFNKDKLENASVRTTIYPITFITKELFQDFAEIKSIYPEDTETTKYKLTNKQVKNYSKDALFIYNGLTPEKDIAKSFVNNNRNILLIDVSYGLSVNHTIDELWLGPNNYLMLAKNIKDNLKEYLDNKYVIETVVENYENIKEKLSLIDADLRKVGNEAKNNGQNFVLSTSNSFKFLENYGFIVKSLQTDVIDDKLNIEAIEKDLKSDKYLFIINDLTYTVDGLTDILVKNKDNVIEIDDVRITKDDFDYIAFLQKLVYKIDLLNT